MNVLLRSAVSRGSSVLSTNEQDVIRCRKSNVAGTRVLHVRPPEAESLPRTNEVLNRASKRLAPQRRWSLYELGKPISTGDEVRVVANSLDQPVTVHRISLVQEGSGGFEGQSHVSWTPFCAASGSTTGGASRAFPEMISGVLGVSCRCLLARDSNQCLWMYIEGGL